MGINSCFSSYLQLLLCDIRHDPAANAQFVKTSLVEIAPGVRLQRMHGQQMC